MNKKIQRNDPCPCGSGEKFKKCCAKKEQEQKQKRHMGLLGRSTTNLSGSMKSIAGRVFKAITAPPSQHDASADALDQKQHGYRTLEELIGIEGTSHAPSSSCCSDEGCCCCHEEEMCSCDEEENTCSCCHDEDSCSCDHEEKGCSCH